MLMGFSPQPSRGKMHSVPCRARVMKAAEVQKGLGMRQLPAAELWTPRPSKAPEWTRATRQELAFAAKWLLQNPPSGRKSTPANRTLCFVYFKGAGDIKRQRGQLELQMPTREVTSFPLIKIIYVVTKAVHIDKRNFRGKKSKEKMDETCNPL